MAYHNLFIHFSWVEPLCILISLFCLAKQPLRQCEIYSFPCSVPIPLFPPPVYPFPWWFSFLLFLFKGHGRASMIYPAFLASIATFLLLTFLFCCGHIMLNRKSVSCNLVSSLISLLNFALRVNPQTQANNPKVKVPFKWGKERE